MAGGGGGEAEGNILSAQAGGNAANGSGAAGGGGAGLGRIVIHGDCEQTDDTVTGPRVPDNECDRD
jgi:hypothetical protein